MIVDPLHWVLTLLGPLLYWLSPVKIRLKILFIISFFYLLYLTPIGVTFLTVWSITFYSLSSLNFRHHKLPPILYLVIAIVIYLISLKFLLKEASFVLTRFSGYPIIDSGLIQLGASYYTFKLIRYATEIRRNSLPQHTLEEFCCYIFFFPIFTAGPIERFDHFLENREKTWSLNSNLSGLTRIIHGLIKKFIIVEILLDVEYYFGAKAGNLLINLHTFQPVEVWSILLLTYLTLYLDFSAYSDIAIGTARLFGFTILENFNWPILATSIIDFWKRWHMTLTGWVQHYVYMPILGISRKPVVAVYLSFLIIGFWHEITFNRLLWGGYHATSIIVCVMWSRSRKKRLKHHASRTSRYITYTKILSTQLFLVSSMVFLLVRSDRAIIDSLRLFQKMLFIN